MKQNIVKQNLIKLYFYCNSGVLIVNDFRNIGLGIFGLYFAMKLDNPMYLLLMGIIALPILAVMGYYNVHHISKVREQLSIKHGTHYGLKQFELIEKQVKLLHDIKRLMQNKK